MTICFIVRIYYKYDFSDTFDDLEAGCDEALRQIEERQYDTELKKDGYRNITKYGVCFYKKECMVKVM